MSEYQYYEFVTVDRQLSHDEMDRFWPVAAQPGCALVRFLTGQGWRLPRQEATWKAFWPKKNWLNPAFTF